MGVTHRNGTSTASHATVLAMLCAIVVGESLSAERRPAIDFVVASQRATYPAGAPVILKVTAHNTGDVPCKMSPPIGWGDGLDIFCSHSGGDFKALKPEVFYAGKWGGGRTYLPVYRLTGIIPTKGLQCIVYMIRGDAFPPGKARFKAALQQQPTDSYGRPIGKWQDFETPIVAVDVQASSKGGDENWCSEQERVVLYECAASSHNYGVARKLKPGLVTLVTKALDAEGTSADLEYALYVGSLAATHSFPTLDDITLAERAGRAFLERFPKSWLCARVYAALFGVYLQMARLAARDGLSLPEANPLYENIGLLKEIEKIGRPRVQPIPGKGGDP